MSSTGGGPAFPAHDYIVGDLQAEGFAKLGETRGMTLRDYFAAKAMQAMLDSFSHPDNYEFAADRAYKMADAMLKARQQ
jgi:hypothetical protein